LHFLVVSLLSVSLFSCVSNKKFKAEKARYETLNAGYLQLQNGLKNCEDSALAQAKQRALLENEIANLNKQLAYLKENNTQTLKQLQDLSVISSSQAESIKKSLENIGAKDAYIQDLQSSIAKKDSLNMALVMNLKGAIGDLDDE